MEVQCTSVRVVLWPVKVTCVLSGALAVHHCSSGVIWKPRWELQWGGEVQTDPALS